MDEEKIAEFMKFWAEIQKQQPLLNELLEDLGYVSDAQITTETKTDQVVHALSETKH